jgi:hypothetical protein
MLVAVLAGGAFANIPDAALSTVPPVLIVPNNPNSGITVDCPGPPAVPVQYGPNNLGWTVNVQGNLGPVVGAVVEVAFSQAAWDRIAKCDGDAPECAFPTGRPAFCDMTGPADYICTAVTNGAGDATFFISGGGCILAAAVNPYTCEVRANGIPLATDIKIYSPDAVNSGGQTTAQSGTSNCDVNTTGVGLSDATFHTGDFSGQTFNACSDFNNNGLADLPDAVIGGQYIINGNGCTCTP